MNKTDNVEEPDETPSEKLRILMLKNEGNRKKNQFVFLTNFPL
jgi:hypothetical protein